MDTVRIARDFGTVSQILPDGLTLFTAPFTFIDAIRAALVFLGWRENLLTEEQPPKKIWGDSEALDAWFAEVERKREDKIKGQGNDREGWDGPMEKNAAVSMILVND